MDVVINNGKMGRKKEIINVIGVLEAIQYNALSIEEAEAYIFSPKYAKYLKTQDCDQQVIELIEFGCELEDVESLLPEKLSVTIANLEKKALDLLKEYRE